MASMIVDLIRTIANGSCPVGRPPVNARVWSRQTIDISTLISMVKLASYT